MGVGPQKMRSVPGLCLKASTEPKSECQGGQASFSSRGTAGWQLTNQLLACESWEAHCTVVIWVLHSSVPDNASSPGRHSGGGSVLLGQVGVPQLILSE